MIPNLLHDGSHVVLRKVASDYNHTDRAAAISFIEQHRAAGEIVTGLLYMDADSEDMHAQANTVSQPLRDLSFDDLCPGSDALDTLFQSYR